MKKSFGTRLTRDLRVNWVLYIMMVPVVVYYVLFSYVPMAGIQLAFKEYYIKLGIWGSPWVGLDNFRRLFSGYNFKNLVLNTVGIGVYTLALTIVTPIIFAVLVNYVRHRRWKGVLQMVTYLPYFISAVVLVGMLQIFLGDNGLLNVALAKLGLYTVPLLSSPGMFMGVFAWSGAWQVLGFSAVIYIATLAGVDPELHEAAIVDGASIWRRIWHIDLPELQPTILLLFILGLGNLVNIDFQKILLMQNPLNLSASEVLSTYVYKVGLINNDYGYSTAVGLFNSVISLMLLVLANRAAKKFAGYSMW